MITSLDYLLRVFIIVVEGARERAFDSQEERSVEIIILGHL